MSRFRKAVAGATAATADTKTPRRPRHAIFYDVENKSSPSHVGQVMAEISLDREGHDTHLVAVGNWRVIGQETARMLATHGAELVHSAPSTGVRDWSDLRIAVDAGIWLGTARPGDLLHIVSDDQAFDAVGDVAATFGVKFARIKMLQRAPVPAPSPRPRGRSSSSASRTSRPLSRPPSRPPSRPEARSDEDAANGKRNASPGEILTFVKRLSGSGSDAGTTLDALSNALKDAGFGRPPGSLRLITRLKRMKEIYVSSDGAISMSGRENEMADVSENTQVETSESAPPPRKRARRGRRGGRRRSGRSSPNGAEPTIVSSEPGPESEPEPE